MKTSVATATALALALVSAPLQADPVTDALESALENYEKGDLGMTAARLTEAQKAVVALQGGKLTRFLPEAPDGWSREIDEDANEGMSMVGMGGASAAADYISPEGDHVTLTLDADNPIVTSMASMLGNPQMMAMMGELLEFGDQRMVNQDGEISGLVANRVLVQATGTASEEQMSEILSMMDFDGLAAYDK